MKTITAVDMFCGAGGTSVGLVRACAALGYQLDLIGINHDPDAIASHTANHPSVRHICENVDNLNPRAVVPSGRLDLLVASPECTHHSLARGGRPMSEQSRASGWAVVRWCEALYIKAVLVENVREFITWGPLSATGRPLRSRKGETFQAFLAALRSLGYTVDFRLVQAANFGDPTTRERLFILARRGSKRIRWPEPSHTANPEPTLFGEKPRWRAAREIIDWSIPSQSIFTRKRPLAPATMRRIAAGLRKFGGASAEPFLVVLRNNGHARSIDAPAPTITAGGNHLGLCTPFLLQQQSRSAPRAVEEPVPTVATKGAIGLVEPFLVQYHGDHPGDTDGERRVQSTQEPLGTVDTANRYALVEPFLVPFFGERDGQAPRAQSLDAPLPAVTSHGAGALVQPFIVQTAHGDNPPDSGRANATRVRTTDDPLFTVDGSGGGLAIVEPFIAPLNHGEGDMRSYSLNHPMPTITSVDAWGIVQPFLLKYNGNGGGPRPLSEPLDTVTTKDRFGLVTAQGTTYAIDIAFRMLRPHELARAQGFPDSYRFSGPRSAQVKQIGNAVPTHTAEALCTAILT